MKKIYLLVLSAILFAAGSFAQPCNPITTFPFTESFGATFPNCWSFSEGTAGATYHWATTTSDGTNGVSAPQSGTNFMFLNVYNASTTYNTYNLTSPVFALPATAKQLKYYYYLGNGGYLGTTGITGADPYPLTVQVSTNGGTTWTDVYNHSTLNTTFASTNAVSNWTLNTISLAAYVNQNVIIRFKSNSNYGSGYCNQAIDEFVIENPPACAPPSSVTISSITTTSASVGFTCTSCTGSYIVEYGAIGFTPGTGATAGAGGTVVTGSASPINISGLTGGTAYDVYVRQNCGVGGYSSNSAKATFTTLCNSITTLPWTEGFEGVSTVGAGIFPSCWSYVNLTGTNSPGTYGTNDSYREPHTGTKFIYTQYNTTAWVFTPGFTLNAGTSYDFSFWMKNKLVTSPVDFVMDVAYGSSNSNAGMTNTLQTPSYTASNSAWTQFKYTFTPATTGNYYFGIKSTSTTSTPWYLSFDDFSLNLTPSCVVPSSVTAGSITTTSASIGFTCTSCTGTYIVEYGAPGFTPGTGATAGAGGTVVTGAASPITISGLSPNTTYDVYVRQNCGGSTFSSNSVKATFTTPCIAVSLPLNEGFNNTTIPSCWSRQFVNGGLDFQYTASSGGTPNPTPVEGTNMVWFNSFYNSGSQTRLVSRPINSTGVSSVDVNFQWYHSSNGGAGSYLTEGVQVQYSTNGTTWTNAGSFIRRYDAVTGWALKNITLPAGAGNQATLYVGFLFASNAGYDSYLDAAAINATPACTAPTGLSASSITQTSASISFTSPGPAILEYGLTGFTPGTGITAGAGGTLINPATSPQPISGLTAGTQYDVYVRQNCTGTGNGYSANSVKLTFTTLLVNDDAPGALTLTVGAGCTGAPYTNAGATQSTGEPAGTCSSTTGYATVWFKFVAPASGAVRVSTDLGSGNTLTDSRIALFSTTNVNNYTTFSIIACDEDGGSVLGSGFMSVLYATGLTPGTTYYVQVDKYSSFTTAGTFCIAVDELSSSMLATSNTCASSYQTPVGSVATYTGWVPLLDGSSKLIALVKNPAGGAPNSFTVGQNINTGAIRQDASGKYYLNRNYRIANSTATNVDVQFFFLNTELAALAAANGTTIGTLGATKQTEAVAGCYDNFVAANGSTLFLAQNGNGSINGVSWIKVTTPGFSNFYLNKAPGALPVTITNFNAQRSGTVNNVTWSTSQEINTSLFVIERSTDGRSFTQIGQVTAAGNSSTLRTYQFTDVLPVKGINYYRLRIVDRDNNIKFSEIKSVRNTGKADFTIYPNPVKDVMKVNIDAEKTDKGVMIITDISGKQVYSRQVNIAAGNNIFTIDISNMAQGAYIIKVQLSDNMIVKKFNKM